MADNYLEKRMEQHRAGADNPARRPKFTPRGDRQGTLTVKFEPLRVVVGQCEDAYGEAIVKRLASAGCKVAFSASDSKRGRELSQATASRFYPSVNYDIKAVVADLVKTWGGVDFFVARERITDDLDVKRIVVIGENPESASYVGDDVIVNAVSTLGVSPEDLAQFVLYLSLPSSKFIRYKVFRF